MGLLTGCIANNEEISTKVNEEINESLRLEIEEIYTGFFKALVDKDRAKVEGYLSEDFLSLKGFDLDYLLNDLSPYILHTTFKPHSEYYTKINAKNSGKIGSISPTNHEDLLDIKYIQFSGEESYNVFLEETNSNNKNLLFLTFSRREEHWKIDLIHMGKFRLNGMTAPALNQKSDAMKKEGFYYDAIFYGMAAKSVLRPAPFLQYPKEVNYLEHLDGLKKQIVEDGYLPFTRDGLSVFDLDIELSRRLGIIPIVKFMTETSLTSSKLYNESEKILEELLAEKIFDKNGYSTVIMRAYNEYPIDSSKKYSYNDVVLILSE